MKEKHLDEELNELLIRIHQLKKKAQSFLKKDSKQDDNKDEDVKPNEPKLL